MSRQLQERHYPESRFGGFTDCDGTVAFYSRVRALVPAEGTVLDVGCGPGNHSEDAVEFRRHLRDFRCNAREVIGIDVDSLGQSNPTIDRFVLVEEGSAWPLEANSVDLAVADCMLEHVRDPDHFLGECARLIRPGGYLCIRTPYIFSYFGLASLLIPSSARGAVIRRVQTNRKAEDVYPAYYHCNTTRKLRRALSAHGFDACVYGYEAEPSYLSFSSLAYALGVVHQHLAPSFLRVALFAFAARV